MYITAGRMIPTHNQQVQLLVPQVLQVVMYGARVLLSKLVRTLQLPVAQPASYAGSSCALSSAVDRMQTGRAGWADGSRLLDPAPAKRAMAHVRFEQVRAVRPPQVTQTASSAGFHVRCPRSSIGCRQGGRAGYADGVRLLDAMAWHSRVRLGVYLVL